jgi:hypothetical protein
MPIEKLLHKIQGDIRELAPTLEVFVEHTIQPTVEDAERLRNQLHALLEDLAVYRHFRSQHEISPSYALHAALSEVHTGDEKHEPVKEKIHAPADKKEHESHVKNEPVVKPLSISINDKFRFINELFSQNASEYGIAVQQFSTLRTLSECEIYLNSLKSLYEWDDNKEIVKRLYSIIRKRFQ